MEKICFYRFSNVVNILQINLIFYYMRDDENFTMNCCGLNYAVVCIIDSSVLLKFV